MIGYWFYNGTDCQATIKSLDKTGYFTIHMLFHEIC